MKVDTATHYRDLVLAHILLRLFISSAILLTIVALYSEAIVSALLPAYKTIFELVVGDLHLINLVIDQDGADRVLRATVTWRHIVVIGGHVIQPNPQEWISTTTLVAHTLQGPLVALLGVIAWPTTQHGMMMWREITWRIVAVTPLLMILILVDMPVVLAGELWESIRDALDPGATSPVVAWKSFMQGGGRYALGLVAALLSIQTARWITLIYQKLPVSDITNQHSDS